MSGCGVFDGSEITEAVSAMIHLSRHNANIEFFAPNIDQLHVVNHVNYKFNWLIIYMIIFIITNQDKRCIRAWIKVKINYIWKFLIKNSCSFKKRNVLHESARIARGNIKSLDKLKAADFNALVVPGGFGAAKNLSDFAVNGVKFTINSEVERIIKEFVVGLKPLGLALIL